MNKPYLRWNLCKRFTFFSILFLICIIPIIQSKQQDKVKSLVSKYNPVKSQSISPQANLGDMLVSPSQEVDETFEEEFSKLTNNTIYQDYHEHTISLFSSMHKHKTCDDINTKHQLNISNYTLFTEDFNKLATVLVYQLENEDAFKDLAPFFQDKIPEMIQNNTVSKYFYKFAGTSVWLKEYGLHIMVSRVLFSRRGIKWDPQISLLYAETFNENWESVNDVELNVSSENMLNFPCFLPVPFYHNIQRLKKRWYGPEDARILLVKNEQGKEEPLVIFNAHHRKFSKGYLKEVQEQKEEQQKEQQKQQKQQKKEQPGKLPKRSSYYDDDRRFTHYRSMFIAWPFQFEFGKNSTDDMPESKYSNIRFNKARELRIEGTDRAVVEKNWTPFIDPSERKPYDSHIHIVYDWEYLQVLKCELTNLTSDSLSHCKTIFSTPGKTEVGPIRGGTELIPINTVSSETDDINPAWIGFVRTHILKCGCGREMYRPHLVIFRRHGNNFKVSHMSSSIGFDIPVISARNMARLCTKGDPNILMPNGISNWEYHDETDSDYLTLSMSRGDADNIMINIKNLGKYVQEVVELEKKWDERDNKMSLNMNSCVLESSKDFCSAYGKTIEKEIWKLKKAGKKNNKQGKKQRSL